MRQFFMCRRQSKPPHREYLELTARLDPQNPDVICNGIEAFKRDGVWLVKVGYLYDPEGFDIKVSSRRKPERVRSLRVYPAAKFSFKSLLKIGWTMLDELAVKKFMA